MAITLGSDRESFPNMRMRRIGNKFVGMLVTLRQSDLTEYETGEVKISAKTGKPRQQMAYTLIAMEGSTAPVGRGKKTDDRDPEVGELVTVYFKGRTFGNLIEARKSCRPEQVGDVITLEFTHGEVTRTIKGKEQVVRLTTDEELRDAKADDENPAYIIDVEVRRATAKEAGLVETAEEHYHRLNAKPPVTLGNGNGGGSHADEDDDGPF